MKKPIKKAIIHFNPSRKAAVETKDEVVEFLREHGVSAGLLQEKTLSHWGDTKIPHFKYSDKGKEEVFVIGPDARRLMNWKKLLSIVKADILITIGGDGTLLFYKGFYNIPIFAIGSHTSFLCQARVGNWRKALSRILKSQRKQEHPMLEARFGKYSTEPAMNEICVKNPRHRMLRFKLYVARKEYSFGADGVIFSTALGSTGYAYSAGGKEFKNEGKVQIVPVAPHRRAFKPMTVPLGQPLCLKTISRYKHDVVDVVVDGQIIYEMGLNASLEIRKSKRKVPMFRA